MAFDIDQEHPEYMARKAAWRKYRDLYAGGERFKTNAAEYLVRRQREPGEVYSERLSRVFYENYVGSIVDWYAATLFRREAASHLSPVILNQARYNDFVPLVYGTAWYQPPVVVARNDGNLTHLEVLLGMGQIEAVLKVIVNDVEVPEGVSGVDMTWTGWYNLITDGARSGSFNPDFPGGDPYGSMAMVSVVVPNQISNGQTLPKIQVLLGGLKLERFDQSGASLGEAFTNNPAWVLLDVLRRTGWLTSEVDLVSFAAAAAYCDEAIQTTDLYGNTVLSRDSSATWC